MSVPQADRAAPDSRLTLLTLGGWGLSYASASQALTPIFGPSKPTALLVYLASAPGQTVRREHLLDLLWADLDPDAAAHALRQTIWYIRQRTTPGVIESVNGSLRLAIAVELDRERFLDAVAQRDMEAAVALYAGDFLPGFAAPGGAEFEKWADLERHRLRTAFIRCAEEVCHRRLASAHFREAVALARRVRDADPLAEPGWRLLLEALTSANDRIGLAAEVDALEQMLVAEDREPDPATRASLRAARHAPPDTPPTTGGIQLVAELVGREREFGAIVEAWGEAQRGKVRHLHFTAPAGLGKSRLLTDTYHRLRAGGARTILLRANPGERQVPFAFAADMAAALANLPGATGVPTAVADALVGLNPSLSDRFPSARAAHAAGTDAIRLRTIAVEEVLRAAAEDGPVATLIDDTHWMDPASAQLLSGLLGRLERERVMVVSTARPTGDRAPSRQDSLHYTLEPLDHPQVSALLASLGTLPDADWARDLAPRLHSASRGFPLLLLETLHLALDQEALRLTGGAWRLADLEALLAILTSGSALRRRVEELRRDQRWLLLVLAVAGRTLAVDTFRDVSPRPDEGLLSDLHDLERRGLVRSVPGGWLPGHDAVAETACELATGEARHAAHAALGKAYARWAPTTPALVPLAAQHLVAADDITSVGPLLALAVRFATSRGDNRPVTAIANDLLGELGTAERIRSLRRMLPLHYRAGITTPARAVAAAALAIAALGGATWGALRPSPPPPDTTLLVRLTHADGSTEYRMVPLREAEWRGGATEAVEHIGSRIVPPAGMVEADSLSTVSRASDLGPTRGWLVTLAYPDSGGQDIALADSTGRLQRLTVTPGDDEHGTLSPDGRYMTITTSAWNARMRYDVAIMDWRTGVIRQLTRGNAHDTGPLWSPDGTRIAFTRTRESDADGQLPQDACVITVTGTEVGCWDAGAAHQYAVLAWSDTITLLLNRTTAGGTGEFGKLDLANGDFTRIAGYEADGVSPDGSWGIRATTGAAGKTETYLFPVRRPGAAMLLSRRDSIQSVEYGWVAPEASEYVAAVEADAPDTLRLGVPYRMRAWARLANRQTAGLVVRSFAIADTSVATVDTSGTILPRRTGSTSVLVSAGGWRAAVLPLQVAPPLPSVALLDEQWDDDVATRWQLYGYPRPQIVEAAGQRVFWNNGDGSYESGAFTLHDYGVRAGLGMETRISAPLDSGQWQQAMLRLTSVIDTAYVRRWNDRTGWLVPSRLAAGSGDCTFSYPYRNIQASGDSATLAIGQGSQAIAPTPHFGNGTWFSVRLQVFPDGRCGVAINGRPIAIGRDRVDLTRRYRIVVSGNSAWTRILVGRLQVWQGVKSDVDWTRLPTQ